jgi:hypothetical protein
MGAACKGMRQGESVMRRSIVLPAIFVAFATAASAQTIVINPNKTGVLPADRPSPVRVSLGISMFVPAPGDDSAQSLKAQGDGRQTIYEAAGHECDLLRATIAESCTLESININVQRVYANQNFGQKVDGYNINGSMNYNIVTKSSGSPGHE